MSNPDPNITMRELLEAYPGAQRALFRKYHIGGCSSCGFQPTETLAGVCARNSVAVEEAIAEIVSSHQEDLKMLIAPRELSDALQAGTLVHLLDLRTREEFEAARIDGAKLFTQDLLQEILTQWNRDQLLVTIDHRGGRSIDAAAYFAGHGFSNAKSLRGGIDAWSQEVDPDIPRYHLE